MTRRRWMLWLGTVLLGVLLAAAVGVLGGGSAHAQDEPPPFPPEDQSTEPTPQLPPPPSPGGTPLPDDPLAPIGPPDDPDLFDIPGRVSSAMHEFLAALVETGMRIVVALLSTTILATPDLTGNEQIRGLWTAMLVIANLTYVLFIVAGGFVVSARETLQTQYGIKEIIPRIVIAGLASKPEPAGDGAVDRVRQRLHHRGLGAGDPRRCRGSHREHLGPGRPADRHQHTQPAPRAGGRVVGADRAGDLHRPGGGRRHGVRDVPGGGCLGR